MCASRSTARWVDNDLYLLEASAQDGCAAVKFQYARQLDQVQASSRAAMAKLDEPQAANEDSWHKRVAEMDKACDAFTRSFHDFKSQV